MGNNSFLFESKTIGNKFIFGGNSIIVKNITTISQKSSVVLNCDVIKNTSNISFNCVDTGIPVDCEPKYIESDIGIAVFKCVCSFIKSTSIFTIECTNKSKSIYFKKSYSYQGFDSSIRLSNDFKFKSNYGYETTTGFKVVDLRIYNSSSGFGFQTSSKLYKVSQFINSQSKYGYYSHSGLLTDPYTLLLDKNPSTGYFGYNNTSGLLTDPYTLLLDKNPSTGYFGYYNKIKFLFNPYTLLLDKNPSTGYFGYYNKIKFLFNPYTLLLDKNPSTGYFGYYNYSLFLTDPYTLLYNGNINEYIGYSSSSGIKYSYDQRITEEPINNFYGYESSVQIKFGTRHVITGNSHFGYFPNVFLSMIFGFLKNKNTFGNSSKIRRFEISSSGAKLKECYAYIGYEFHDNHNNPRYFDLDKIGCCQKPLFELLHVEMTDLDDWNIIYGRGWSFKSTFTLKTEPRFRNINNEVGYDTNLVDSSIYLFDNSTLYGFASVCKGLIAFATIELGTGNYITKQEDIKIELSKPLDKQIYNDLCFFGYESYTNLYNRWIMHVKQYKTFFDPSSTANLVVKGPLVGFINYFGYKNESILSCDFRLYKNSSFIGFSSNLSKFKTFPWYSYYNMYSSYVSAITTENWVELLEEGELENNYKFLNENGDVVDQGFDPTVSVEGYPYSRYIKGRCY